MASITVCLSSYDAIIQFAKDEGKEYFRWTHELEDIYAAGETSVAELTTSVAELTTSVIS